MTLANVDHILFDEVAIADFGSFQIAALTTTTTANRKPLSIQISKTERVYHNRGYLIHDCQIIACLEGLTIGVVGSEHKLFKPIQRIAPAVELTFEVKSDRPLPRPILAECAFACQFPHETWPYHGVFRQVSPRFVRIYRFAGATALPEQVEQLQAEARLFVSQNHEQLRQVPFYRDTFGLQNKQSFSL